MAESRRVEWFQRDPGGTTSYVAPGVVADHREVVGRRVREIWVEWAREQADPKPSWLLPWEEIDEGQREVDMRIGAALFDAGQPKTAQQMVIEFHEKFGVAVGEPWSPELAELRVCLI